MEVIYEIDSPNALKRQVTASDIFGLSEMKPLDGEDRNISRFDFCIVQSCNFDGNDLKALLEKDSEALLKKKSPSEIRRI